jgi:hypothetical protein
MDRLLRAEMARMRHEDEEPPPEAAAPAERLSP